MAYTSDNTFQTEQRIAMTLGLLYREMVLPRLVWRDAATDFGGKQGDTVTVRVPGVLSARDVDRNSDIVTDEIEETAITVKLDKHVYSAVAITDEDETLEIEDFGAQITTPQVRAVAEKLEDHLIAAMKAATFDADVIEVDTGDSGDDPFEVFLEVSKALNVRNVPRAQRRMVLGADLERWVLSNDKLHKVNEAGTDEALREAEIGRLAGFDLYGSNGLDEDEAVAFHRTAFVLSNRAPIIPQGVTWGAAQSFEGLAMRYIRDYDASKLQDRAILSSLMGATSVEETTGEDSPLPEEANFRAVKIEATS